MPTTKQEYMRKYREANREKIRVQDVEYYRKNQEKIRARQAEYREANREKLRALAAAHYEANREKIREYQRQYREAKREARRAELNARKAEYYEAFPWKNKSGWALVPTQLDDWPSRVDLVGLDRLPIDDIEDPLID